MAFSCALNNSFMLRSRPERPRREGKVRSRFRLVPFIVGQVDDDWVFLRANEFGCVILGVAEDLPKERFACALYGD
jgi:hypothetical protein